MKAPRTLLSALSVALILAACATLPPAKPIQDFESIAGKWQGWGASPRGDTALWVNFNEDGTYQWEGSYGGAGTGTARIIAGKIHSVSSSGRRSIWSLHEAKGKRVLKGVSQDGGSTWELKPAK